VSAIASQKCHTDDENIAALNKYGIIKIARITKAEGFLLLLEVPHSVTPWTSFTVTPIKLS